MGKGIKIFGIIVLLVVVYVVAVNVNYQNEAKEDEAERIEAERIESLKTPEQRYQESTAGLYARVHDEAMEKASGNTMKSYLEAPTNAYNNIEKYDVKSTVNNDQCDLYTERLNELSNSIKSLTYQCESVPFGSDSGFYEFSSKMQDLENILREQSIHPKTINVKTWKLFNDIEDDCDHNPGLQKVTTVVKNNFAWMGLCFEDMYEEFGEFPAMEIGLSHDYFD